MKVENYGAGVFVVKNYLTVEECNEYISLSHKMGYEEAGIQTADGPKILKTIRNNDRVIFDDISLAQKLFLRVKEYLPKKVDDLYLKGFNERFRYYRYEKGQYFDWHKDGSYVRSTNEESMLTFLIYLNEDFKGGATMLSWETIQPTSGMALFFPHRLLHRGVEVETGIKYVLRTDVMYNVEV
jgi:Rps23 Pro-64 3,4-dihydroxylase Tpa1-like proline 4-hydroxylase